MIEGLRRAQQGILPRIQQQESLANNLANALTPGFKRDRVSFEAVLAQAANGDTPPGLPGGPSLVSAPRMRPDFSPGPVETTGNPLDMALSGDGFFAVQTPNGERYTRAGNFTRDSGGMLATADGKLVLGQGGPIKVDGDLAVSGDGSVSVNGEARGKLKLVRFEDPTSLTHEGGAQWASSKPPVPATSTSVRQGYLESSNVNTVGEMVDMMTAFRSYEANVKSVQIQGDSLTQLLGSVTRR